MKPWDMDTNEFEEKPAASTSLSDFDDAVEEALGIA